MHIERLDKETAAISFTHPLTAYAAFALTISLLDGRAANDFVVAGEEPNENLCNGLFP